MNNYIVRRNNRIYRKALKREMAIWERSARELNPANEVANKEETISENNPILLKYFNKKLGIKNKSEFGWVDFIVNNYEPVQTSLSLGSGSEKFEKAFLERGFTKNFNTIDIVSIEGPNNYDNDLNFIKFENNKYDFILCKSILHHIINLEYLLYQVNSALKENGILVVYEYIGEDKQQWNDKKINILNYKLKDEFGEGFPFLKIDKHPMKNISPFESIRSMDIVPILREYYAGCIDYEITWGTFTYTVINHLSRLAEKDIKVLKDNPKLIERILEFVIQLEEKYNSETLLPCYLFGIYKKANSIKKIEAHLWSNKKLRYNLNLHIPTVQKIKILLKNILV